MVDEKVYRERIIEPTISLYKTVLKDFNYTPTEIESILEEKSNLIQSRKLVVIPILQSFCIGKCTLNCKHCGLQIPRVSNFSSDFVQVKKEMEIILDNVDEVIQCIPTGGEALLWNHLEMFLDYALSHHKILSVTVITNATLIPRNSLIPFMQHPKFMLTISDYGNIKQRAELVEFCEKNKIKCNVHVLQKWFSTDWRPHNRTKEELERQFSRCIIGKTCKTFLNGRLYHCPEIAAMVETNMICLDNTQSLAIMDETSWGGGYINFATTTHLEACDMCSFYAEDSILITPGEQINNSFDISEFTIIKRDDLAEKIRSYDNLLDMYNRMIMTYEQSVSWRITKPLRKIKQLLSQRSKV